LWFQVFGALYAALSAIGFETNNGMICGVISNNQYDSWGHGALALVLLLIGFATPERDHAWNAPAFVLRRRSNASARKEDAIT
jgi:hypothetical protein